MFLMFWIASALSPSLVWQSQAGNRLGLNSSQHDQSPLISGGLKPLPLNRESSNNTECANHSVKDFSISYQRKVYSLKSLMRELTKIDIKTPCESNLLKAVQRTTRRREFSCRGRCGLKQRNSNMLCFCDIHCSHFGDCCYDFHSSCSRDKLRDGSVDIDSTTCEIANQPTTWHGEAMISTCPLSPDNNKNGSSCFSDDRTLNLRLEVPVIDRRNNRTYRSVTCASCNNITDVIPWVLKVSKCYFLKNVTNIIDWLKKHPGQCSWKYEAPSPGQNDVKCILRMSLNSPRALLGCGQLPIICDICNSYAMVFKFEGKFHRNPHCVLCDPKSGKGHSADNEHGPPISLTALINFNANREVLDEPVQHVNNTNTSGAAKSVRHEIMDAEQIITTVGCCTSIVALLVLIVVYALFKELRNLPGKVLMNLACSIIFYQAVFLSSGQTEIRAVCVAIAVLLHYFLLASFVWMAVMGYDLAKTFTSNGVNVHQENATKKLVIYCCFAWGGPLALVALCFTLDVTGSAYFGYGMREDCWIQSGFAKMISFGVPVALALLFNTVAMVRTMIAIHQTKKATQRVSTQRAQPSLAFLCVKLTMVLGVPWVLGYVMKYALVLRYIYIVLNAFQGLFISLVFLAKKRVFKLIRHKVCNADIEPDGSTTTREIRPQTTRSTHAYYQERQSFEEEFVNEHRGKGTN